MSYDKVIVIDNGSYTCRVGYNDSENTVLEFRNVVAKPRRDKRKDTIINDNVYQVGNEIDVDAMRLLIKSPFERNVLIHPIYEEHIFDYIFGHLATDDKWLPYPIIMTEPLANPQYCRQILNELLFECYNVPAVCYGIDCIYNWEQNRKSNEIDALILSFGYHTTHVVPILNGKLQHSHVRRLNLGGYEMISYLHRLVQMKYPAHLNAITLTRIEDILHKHSTVALDYTAELRKWDSVDYYDNNVKIIQLPYIQTSPVSPMTVEKKLKKRQELVKRLIEANQRRLKEKREEGGEENIASNVPNKPRNKPYQPPDNINLQDWLKDIRHKQEMLLQKKSDRNKRRQELMRRHTLASQERMRIISLLASNEKGSDEFGKDDKDWDVYKQISHENENDSDEENEKLMEYENILKHHHMCSEQDNKDKQDSAELYQLHIGVESLRAPELLFQPSIIGLGEAGLADLINFVLYTFPLSQQQRLANNIYMTGGCSQFPGLQERLSKELKELRPFNSTFSIRKSKNPVLDSWFGAKSFSNSAMFKDYVTTKADYEEKGSFYFKEHSRSNLYNPYTNELA